MGATRVEVPGVLVVEFGAPPPKAESQRGLPERERRELQELRRFREQVAEIPGMRP